MDPKVSPRIHLKIEPVEIKKEDCLMDSSSEDKEDSEDEDGLDGLSMADHNVAESESRNRPGVQENPHHAVLGLHTYDDSKNMK